MKQLIHVDGNLLLNDNVHVIGHSCNCQNVFGGGIALSIKKMYPEAYSADTEAAREGTNRLGNFSKAELTVDRLGKNQMGNQISRVYNLYGQNLGIDHTKLYGRKTNYEALYTALERMSADLMMIEGYQSPPIGFPWGMGSGLGGGVWSIVERFIEVAFDKYNGDVYIYKFQP